MHTCGQCTYQFDTEEGYLTHLCEKTGYTPTQPEHQGEDFLKVSQAALQRGEARKALEEQGIDPEQAQEQTADVGSTVQ